MEVRPIQREFYLAEGTFSKDNFFGSEVWLQAHGGTCHSYGIFNKDTMFGAFHLYHYTRLGKQFVINPPMAPHCGLKLLLHGEKNYSRQSELKRMTTAMATFFKQEFKNAYIDFCLPDHLLDVQAFQWKGFLALPKYTYLLDIVQSENELLRQMSTERRKNIKNAPEQGYLVQHDAPINDLIQLISNTLGRVGAPFKHEVLRMLLEQGKDDLFTTTVYKDGILLAACVCAHDRNRTYYLAGGHDADSGDSLAGTLALWSAIQEAQLCGCSTFDFLGSSVPTIEKYFRGFGAQLKPYFNIQSGPGFISWLKSKRHKYTKF